MTPDPHSTCRQTRPPGDPPRNLQPPLGQPPHRPWHKTAATANLQTGLAQAEEILAKGPDKLAYQFRATDFYKEYQSARKKHQHRRETQETQGTNHTR